MCVDGRSFDFAAKNEGAGGRTNAPHTMTTRQLLVGQTSGRSSRRLQPARRRSRGGIMESLQLLSVGKSWRGGGAKFVCSFFPQPTSSPMTQTQIQNIFAGVVWWSALLRHTYFAPAIIIFHNTIKIYTMSGGGEDAVLPAGAKKLAK